MIVQACLVARASIVAKQSNSVLASLAPEFAGPSSRRIKFHSISRGDNRMQHAAPNPSSFSIPAPVFLYSRPSTVSSDGNHAPSHSLDAEGVQKALAEGDRSFDLQHWSSQTSVM